MAKKVWFVVSEFKESLEQEVRQLCNIIGKWGTTAKIDGFSFSICI
jgi:hypothetical protein